MAVFGLSTQSTIVPDFRGRCLVSYGFNSPLTVCLLLLTAWCMVALAGLLRPLSIAFVGRTLFPVGACCGAALAVVAGTTLFRPPPQVTYLASRTAIVV